MNRPKSSCAFICHKKEILIKLLKLPDLNDILQRNITCFVKDWIAISASLMTCMKTCLLDQVFLKPNQKKPNKQAISLGTQQLRSFS